MSRKSIISICVYLVALAKSDTSLFFLLVYYVIFLTMFDQCVFVCFFSQITYIETSAKDPPMNVDKAFHELVRVIRSAKLLDLKAMF